jgi:hypothetical protein
MWGRHGRPGEALVELRRYQDVATFYRRAEPFLVRREAEHNLTLGICAVLKDGGSYGNGEPPYLATVESDGAVLAAAVRTPPHNLVLSHRGSLGALDLLARDIHESGQALSGAIGPTTVSQAFAERWHSLTGQASRRGMALRIYQLTAVSPVEGVSGNTRPATEADRDLLEEWGAAFQVEALGETDREGIARSVERYLRADPRVGGVYVWEDGRPVSMASYGGPTPNGIRVGWVYTPPEHRRRGYASGCVAALSRHLLDAGRKFCFLYTNLANPTSNHIYQAIGYVPVRDVDEYRFGPAPATRLVAG